MTRPGVAAWAAAALLGSCAPTEVPDARRDLLRSWGEDTLLPWYGELEADLETLGTRVQALCESATESTLASARDAWWAARAPWKRAEVFAFGPYSEQPLRLGPKIDFWTVRTEDVEAVLAGDAALDDTTIAAMGASQTGLPALEYLLFGPDAAPAAFVPASRRCRYATGLVADLRTHVRELREAWEPAHGAFLDELVQAGRGSARYDTLPMALGEMVNRMAFTLENIRGDKLGRPLGLASGGGPQADKSESRFSGRAIEDIRDNLAGLERLYEGEPEAGIPGLDTYLQRRGRKLAPRFRAGLAEARRALGDIGLPLAEAVSEAPARVEAAITALGALQRVIQVDVLGALSLTAGFNDNDGD